MTRPRFVILPVEVAGYAARLREGLQALGEEAEFWCLGENPFGYEFPRPHGRPARLMIWIARAGAGTGRSRRALSRLVNLPIKVVAVLLSYRRGTVLVCMSGRSLLGGWDRRYALWRGATVISVYLGSDSRPAYLNGVRMNADDEPDWPQIHSDVKRMSRDVRRAERRSTYVVCSPASAQFLRQPFVNWFRIGMPIVAASGSVSSAGPPGTGTVRVLHAPSRPRQKGSMEFAEAIAALEAQGVDLEYVQLRKAPNSEVRRQIEKSDLVIDELYSDTFLGGIGVEAAVAGVPVLTFGYADGLFAEVVGVKNYPREGYAEPSDMLRIVRKAVSNPAWRRELAEKQADFVRSHWSAEAVASRYVEMAERRLDPEWLLDPRLLSYLWGFGMPQSLLKARLTEYVRLFGGRALELAPGGAADLAAEQIVKGG